MDSILVKQTCINKTVIYKIAKNSTRAVAIYFCIVIPIHILPLLQDDRKAISELLEKGTEGTKNFKYVMEAIGTNVPLTIIQL